MLVYRRVIWNLIAQKKHSEILYNINSFLLDFWIINIYIYTYIMFWMWVKHTSRLFLGSKHLDKNLQNILTRSKGTNSWRKRHETTHSNLNTSSFHHLALRFFLHIISRKQKIHNRNNKLQPPSHFSPTKHPFIHPEKKKTNNPTNSCPRARGLLGIHWTFPSFQFFSPNLP